MWWIFLSFILCLVPDSVSAARKTEWSLHLDSKIEATAYPEKYGDETNSELYKLELIPIYRWKYLESWRLHLKPVFIANPNNNSDDEKYFFDPAESYIRYQTESLSLQAGYNIFTWGVTDGYNPLDIINSKQYFDPLRSRKLGALSFVYSQGFGSWELDLVYIPKNNGALLPGEESRWLPREVFVPQTAANDLILKLPENLRYSFSERKNLSQALDHNFAFRLQRRGEYLDLAVSGYEGAASFPYVEPVVTGSIVQVSPKTVIEVDPDVLLNTYNYRIRQGGLSLVLNHWDMLFKAVGSYTQNLEENTNLQKWTNENVLGVEKNFNLGSQGLLIAILQYSFVQTDKKNDSNLSITEIFRSAYMAGGRITWKEVWGLNVLGLYDSIHGSTYQQYSLSRRIQDAWVLTLSADLIQGTSETPLGVYGKNDSYSLSLSRSF